eukprot:TRINITY_DN4205_c0_g2_i1.p1 TRINITY_DN4205_c0_g2~~TRINITY_DN4205_c0_g2_i1.p1  ORF type:complete len:178 (-),score=29.64 TRINITY_DN4205_c0_g2_i1:128-661(-)
MKLISCRTLSQKVLQNLIALRFFTSSSVVKEEYLEGPLKVGHFATLKKSFTQLDVNVFSELSEDRNPLHLDVDFCSKTLFSKPIVHGFLVSSLMSAVAGCHLPGPGTIYLSQTLNFKKPVFPGDEITAKLEVLEVQQQKRLVKLSTSCWNQKGEVVIDGDALVMVPSSKVRKVQNNK